MAFQCVSFPPVLSYSSAVQELKSILDKKDKDAWSEVCIVYHFYIIVLESYFNKN